MVFDRLQRALPINVISSSDDAQLVELARGGAPAAFDELFNRHHRRVFDFAYHMLSDPDAADDVVQEVFLRAHRAIDRFRGSCAVRSWIMRIAVNECISHRRRARRRNGDEALRDDIESSMSVATAAETSICLRGALAQLRPVDRALVLLRDVGGFSYAEIGEAIKSSESSVGVRLHRARKRLRSELEKSLPKGATL